MQLRYVLKDEPIRGIILTRSIFAETLSRRDYATTQVRRNATPDNAHHALTSITELSATLLCCSSLSDEASHDSFK